MNDPRNPDPVYENWMESGYSGEYEITSYPRAAASSIVHIRITDGADEDLYILAPAEARRLAAMLTQAANRAAIGDAK